MSAKYILIGSPEDMYSSNHAFERVVFPALLSLLLLEGTGLGDGFTELGLDGTGVFPKDDNFKETVLGDNGEIASTIIVKIKR